MNILKKSIVILLICTFVIIPQTGCGVKEVSNEGFYLNTICTITIYDQTAADGEKLISEAFELCEEYENLFSKTVEGSDIYRINNAGGEPVKVDDDTIELLKKGIEYGEVSDGKFDITIGAVSELWDFNSEDAKVPDDTQIQEALKTVDYTQININGNEVFLQNPDAKIDLGGIAKGYIADRISEFLQEKGVEQAIINLGGNIVALNEKDKNTPWVIGLERPYSDRTDIIGKVEAVHSTISTSGIYERYFTQDGKEYHHVLDPDTGYPAETELAAVSLKTPVGYSAESDAFGTIFLIVGEDAANEILKDYPDFQAAFIYQDDAISTGNGMVVEKVK